MERRTYLRGIAATGATALLGSAAGCTGGLLASPPSYADWLYAPGTVTGAEAYAFTHLDVATVRENEDEFEWALVELYEAVLAADLSGTGVDLPSVDAVTAPVAGSAFEGSFDAADVESALADAGYEERGEEGGFRVYATGDGNAARGIRDGTLLSASSGLFSGGDPLTAVRELAATKAGERERYAAADPAVGAMLERVGDGFYVTGGTDGPFFEQFDDQVGQAVEFRLEDPPTDATVRNVYVFESGDDVRPDYLQSWMEANSGTLAYPLDLRDVSAEGAGRTAVVTGTADTDDLFVDAAGAQPP